MKIPKIFELPPPRYGKYPTIYKVSYMLGVNSSGVCEHLKGYLRLKTQNLRNLVVCTVGGPHLEDHPRTWISG